MLPEAFDIVELALDLLKDTLTSYRQGNRDLRQFPQPVYGPGHARGGLEHYDGLLRVMDSEGRLLEDGADPERYRDIIGEAVRALELPQVPLLQTLGL